MKPTTCREIGCAGLSCKHYKPVEEYPFYKCMYETENEEEEYSDGSERP